MIVKQRSEKKEEGRSSDGRARQGSATKLCSSIRIGHHSFVVSPTIEANNFELNLALVTFIVRDDFGGHPTDYPNVHLQKFFAKYNTIKLNRVSTDAI